MFGLDISNILAQIRGQLAPELERLKVELECKLDALISAVLSGPRGQEYEFGRGKPEVRGHDPAVFPAIVKLAGKQRANLAALLSKTVTRGFAANIGTNPAILRFWKEQSPEPSAPFTLLPGQTVDFSWFFDEISVEEATPGQPVEVEVLAQ
ncbi:hypothetical protein Mesil_1774 [Allomeiothermus silvanus DSM 9946]|uniref:Uncharacterized protein n=1 Tax=Allomeiothermus silvanus (strain ATCC 700542 / DSM 9946 / NBRC 106475 / NCIMB 13440 / VI-R2) TaxID=526227 RepID=D7BFU9_ALLS1|nr:hypothetical protein [Allomeiothermus silvanus]ADH63652.1 hypothetical protein Mesil_1774 [Allomeiothermus silvanus DSM 9946]